MNTPTTPGTTPGHGGPDDGWESEMGDEFERRVRGLHEAPLTLTAVKGRATSIRRRRRVAVAGGILAAAAVIVPVAVLATGAGSDRAETIEPAVPSVTVTDPALVPSPTPAAPSPTAPANLPGTGPALGFSYLEVGSADTIYHRADGTTAELPGTNYLGAADLGDQIAALRSDDSSYGRSVDLIKDGRVATTYVVRSDLAIAPDGRTVAFVTTDDELLFVNGEHGEQSFGTIEPGVTLSSIIGNGDCSLESGCHPFLAYDDFTLDDAFEINYEGDVTAPAPGALRVNDAADGFLVSVQTASTDTGSCGGLYDREGGGRWLFETCASQVLDISPTGDYVVGTDPYGDGLGPRYFSILDAANDGKEVARWETDRGFVVGNYSWVDDTHVGAVVNDDGAWKIVSLGVDGTVEVLAGPVKGVDFPEPFVIVGGDAG